MRIRRSLPFLVLAAALPLLAAGLADACKVSSAYVAGKFDEAGNFVVTGALDSDGNALQNAGGFVCSRISTADDVALAASDYTDQIVYVIGDLDFDNQALHVTSFTTSSEAAAACVAGLQGADAKTASARIAGAGPGCCAAKGAAAKTASAQATGTKAAAGAGCSAAKGAAAKTASTQAAGTKSAGAIPAHCLAARASGAKAAGARAGCCAAKGTAAAKATPDQSSTAAANAIVFDITGMTCGACVSRVESAVAALQMKGIESCVVSLEDGTAVVTASGNVDREAIRQAITKAGFAAELRKDS